MGAATLSQSMRKGINVWTLSGEPFRMPMAKARNVVTPNRRSI